MKTRRYSEAQIFRVLQEVDAWKPNRHTVFDKVLKGTFSKLDVIPIDIDADLTNDCVPKFADYYDSIAKTDILLIYNVMNEIDIKHSAKVWRNIDFILRNCRRPLLILLMEPSVLKARPRSDWLKMQLAQCSNVICESTEQEVLFDSPPMQVDFEGTNLGLNDRLFGQVLDGGKSALKRSLKRTHIACGIEP